MGKPEVKPEDAFRLEAEKEYYPLFMLKQELMEKMDFSEDHAYKIFCTWRFRNSVRKEEVFKKNSIVH